VAKRFAAAARGGFSLKSAGLKKSRKIKVFRNPVVRNKVFAAGFLFGKRTKYAGFL